METTNTTDTVSSKNCLYYNKPFTKELWYKICINSLEKLAENSDNEEAMFNLANRYYNGEETEKNLEKAFHWYQKSAENGKENAMFNLAICYENGEGTEKDLEKAIYWYQEAAENGNICAMNYLAEIYKDGKVTEKNFNKTLYWYQKAIKTAENNSKTNNETCIYHDLSGKTKLIKLMKKFIIELEEENYNECYECHMRRRPSKNNQQICVICYQAKLLYKQSGNEIIDEFIKYTQINFIQESSRMKFISYDRFKSIEFIKAGGFSKIYKATWIDGPHSWNEEKEDFEYEDPNIIVALKQLNNSENISFKELKELLMIYIADIN
ncbi:HCP-like protein [Rhizophagus irregularis]|nr:HCP-like protein [Rhizophagus irregularis]